MRYKEIKENDEAADLVGERLAELLGLKRDKNLYQTTWGTKTKRGLARTILAVIEQTIRFDKTS